RRADGEIDAAGDHDCDLSKRHDGDEREIAGGVEEIIFLEKRSAERRLDEGHDDRNDDHRNSDPERLLGDDLLPQGRSWPGEFATDLGCRVCAYEFPPSRPGSPR